MIVYFTDDGKSYLHVVMGARDISELVNGTPNPSDSYMLIPGAYSGVE